MKHEIYYICICILYMYYIYIIYYMLYIIYYIIYILYYIHIYIARGLMFARNPRNSMQDCNLLCSLGACSFFANCEHTKYCYFLRLTAFLRLPITLPKSPFEACLKDTLRYLQCFELLTSTSTNHKTLKEHQHHQP